MVPQHRQTKVAGEALSRPVVSDGLVLIHTSNGQLQALNETDGAVKWTVNLDMPALSLRGESAPTAAFGAAIVGGDNGRVSAVLMQQGQLIWQQRISRGKRTDGNRSSERCGYYAGGGQWRGVRAGLQWQHDGAGSA